MFRAILTHIHRTSVHPHGIVNDTIHDRISMNTASQPGMPILLHIAISLGIQACFEGYKVLFYNAPNLINRLKEARSERMLLAVQRQFESYDLVIIDELGYISFDKEGGELLFTHLSLRAERKSTIITTNLSFEKWEDIFKDPVMTSAIIDRITHKALAINMNGNSYRLRETQKLMKHKI